MEQFHTKQAGKFGSVVFSGLILLLTTSQAHSITGHWICGSGAWENPSCWDYTDTDGEPGLTPDRMDEARLISADGVDRTVTRSGVYLNEYFESTIDATGSGSMTVVQTDGQVGSGVFQNAQLVGVSGTGTLTQTGGYIGGNLRLGVNAGGSGTYNLNDGRIDSEWSITAGDSGTGLVNQSGGNASVGALVLGRNDGSGGTYNLTGGHLWIGYNTMTDISWIGKAGTGVFNQSAGDHRTETGIYIGETATGQGTYTMSGGEVNAGSFLIVGDEGTGTFEQTGGTVNTKGYYNDFTSSEGGVFIGRGVGGHGAYNLHGGSSTSNAVNVGIDGHGEFNQSGGSHVVNETLTVGSGGASGSGVYNMSGGVLVASDIVVNSNGAFNISAKKSAADPFTHGGKLALVDTKIVGNYLISAKNINVDQFTNGGKLALVDPSVDTKIVGNYLQLSDGILELGARLSRFKGFENSRLDVSGTATLGGTLDFPLDFNLGSFAASSRRVRGPSTLFEFDILSAETIVGKFDVVELPDLGALDRHFDWKISYILNDFGTDYVRLSMVRSPMGGRPYGGPSIAHTPEPATLLLMVPALAGMGFARRKKRNV